MQWNLQRPEDVIASSAGGDSIEQQTQRDVFFAWLEDFIAWV